MARSVDEIAAEVEGEGDISESISFDSVIKAIEEEDPEVKELMEELPALAMLLRTVHKQGFWRGVDFGRKMVMGILEEETTGKRNGVE